MGKQEQRNIEIANNIWAKVGAYAALTEQTKKEVVSQALEEFLKNRDFLINQD